MNKDSVLKTPISKPLAMENQPPPYHAFEHLGEFFVYDTYNCAFFHIDEPTKIFLDLCLEINWNFLFRKDVIWLVSIAIVQRLGIFQKKV